MKKSYHSMLDAASEVSASLPMLILPADAVAAAVMVPLPNCARRDPALAARGSAVPPPSEEPEGGFGASNPRRVLGVRPRTLALAGLSRQSAGELGHVIEVGLEGAQTLGQAAQFGDQALAFGLGQIGLDPLPAAPVFAWRQAQDLAAP